MNCGWVRLPGDEAGADSVTVGTGGAVVSNTYVADPATLVLPAASVAVTDRVYEPSRPAPLRSTVVVGPQLTADAGTDVGPLTEHAKLTPASASDTENCGLLLFAGEDVGTDNATVGTGGGVVSRT